MENYVIPRLRLTNKISLKAINFALLKASVDLSNFCCQHVGNVLATKLEGVLFVANMLPSVECEVSQHENVVSNTKCSGFKPEVFSDKNVGDSVCTHLTFSDWSKLYDITVVIVTHVVDNDEDK